MSLFSVFDSFTGLLRRNSDTAHTFYTSDRSSPITGVVTAVGPRNATVRTRAGKEVKISLSTLTKKDRNFIDLWLKRHPLPQRIEALPELNLSVMKRIDPNQSSDQSEPRLTLFFDVTVGNETDSNLEAITIAYTLFNQHATAGYWEAVKTGELVCELRPKERQTHCIAGALQNPDGKYGPQIHRILIYGLISGNVVAQTSDSQELLRHVSLQNANLAV